MIKSKLSGLRVEGEELSWHLQIEDDDQDLVLHINALPISKEYQITSDINNISTTLSNHNTDMLDHFLWIDDFEMELQQVSIDITRVDSSTFRAKYFIQAGETVTGEYNGKVDIVDGGVSLLDHTNEQIEEWLKNEYHDYPLQIEWGTTGWGVMATIKRLQNPL